MAAPDARPTDPGPAADPPVDDTSSCPVARCCEACENTDDVMVVTAQAPTGVLCVTLCGLCIDRAEAPRFSLLEVCSRVLLHCCEHVGIDPDDMTAFGTVTR